MDFIIIGIIAAIAIIFAAFVAFDLTIFPSGPGIGVQSDRTRVSNKWSWPQFYRSKPADSKWE
jgi:hypothetical protein